MEKINRRYNGLPHSVAHLDPQSARETGLLARETGLLHPYDPQHPLGDARVRYGAAMGGLSTLVDANRRHADVETRNLETAAREVVTRTGDLIRMCREHDPGQHLSLCLQFAVPAQEELNTVRRMARAPHGDPTYILQSESLPEALRCVPWLIAARPKRGESKAEEAYFTLLTEACAANGSADAGPRSLVDLGETFKEKALLLLVELYERDEHRDRVLEFVNCAATLLKQLASQAGLQDHPAFELRHGGSPLAEGLVKSLLPPASAPLRAWWTNELLEVPPTTIEASTLPVPGTDAISLLQPPGDTHEPLADLAQKLPRFQARFDYKRRQHDLIVDSPDVVASSQLFKSAAYELLRQTLADGINDTSVKEFNAVWENAQESLKRAVGRLEPFDPSTLNVFFMTEEMPADIAGLAQAVGKYAPGSATAATAAGTAVDQGYEGACETMLVASRSLLAKPDDARLAELTTQAQNFKAEALRVMRALRDAGDTSGFMFHCIFSQRYLNEALWGALKALGDLLGASLPPEFDLWADAPPGLATYFNGLAKLLKPVAPSEFVVGLQLSYDERRQVLSAHVEYVEHGDINDLVESGESLRYEFMTAAHRLMHAYLSEDWNGGKGGPDIEGFLRVQEEAQSLLTSLHKTISSVRPTDAVPFDLIRQASASLKGWMAVFGLLPSSPVPPSESSQPNMAQARRIPVREHHDAPSAFTHVVPGSGDGGLVGNFDERDATDDILVDWEGDAQKKRGWDGEGSREPDGKRPKQ